MSIPVAAIVGRPNVGKSTLFNKLTGKRISIVEDTPGVTRDRIYHEAEWRGRRIMLVDTGGIEPRTDSMMLKYMRKQAELAIETADVIIFMTDINVGMTDDDRQIGAMLMRSGKPVILAVNKVDRIGDPPAEFYEFYQLGFRDDPIALSSLHGSGSGDLLDRVLELCPEEEEQEGGLDDDVIRVAVIGKPNAGKSSIINRILGSDRLIVSDVAGTTRDAIDSEVENEYGKYVFIDTAGIRRQSKVDDPIEKYSVLRAKLAVDRADVCVIMIDAEQGITEQDERIAGIAHEAGKPSVICINKWDLIEKDNATTKEFTEKVYKALSYMTYAPVIFLSAKTGQRVGKLFGLINSCCEQSKIRITTGTLNDVLNDATARVQPPSDKGRYLKIYYMTQIGIQPPTFVIFCNSAELFHFSYRRYIENCLRETFGFKGTPIKLIIRERGEEQ
ncbi:MAG: ribosome biogenesis GTPase Der [Firmicutes bacterium]|uniref:GTPase Der n=1 Tax=Candidatus Colimorpha enterica TaxID=3083063 RepID=R6U0B6_9BACT|nr:ribosome biogenesis GTPase Der [Candidatus Colimorpha enterica]MDD6322661.1 ribosome biogenesis GTPase Der [Bacillota bacterium]MDY2906263.1 ribosome biogenesis GTPase Der [Eubacteriales bacterium]CDC73556.1 gTPase Der [Candidatus Colimorpha enterica]